MSAAIQEQGAAPEVLRLDVAVGPVADLGASGAEKLSDNHVVGAAHDTNPGEPSR